jgi:hypothetical protein
MSQPSKVKEIANGKFIPAVLAQHTVESLYAEHGRQRPWIYWSILLFCLGGFAALPLVKVDITVRAAGAVRPAVIGTHWQGNESWMHIGFSCSD